MISIPLNCKLSIQQVNHLMNNQTQLRDAFFSQEKRRLRIKYDKCAVIRHSKTNMNKVLIDIEKHFII